MNYMAFLRRGKTNWKYILIISFLVAVVGGGVLWSLQKGVPFYQSFATKASDESFNKEVSNCNEIEVTLEGRLNVTEDKYPIHVIESTEGTYWMYGPPKDFNENFGKIVRIEGILSPAYAQADPLDCNVCYRECNTCQCPLDEPLLYNVEIVGILE